MSQPLCNCFFTSGWFYLTFVINVCCWYKSQCLYCWPRLSPSHPKTSEVSSCALKSLAAHWSSWNGRALHGLCDVFWFVLTQLFVHLGTLAKELWTSGFLKFLRGGRFLRSFLGHLFLNVLIHTHGYPGHLDTSFGPRLIGGLHLFIMGIRSCLFHNCCRALWCPSHFSHFEGSPWSAPEPLSTLIYTPPQGATPLCFEVSKSLCQPMVALGEPWHHKALSWHL